MEQEELSAFEVSFNQLIENLLGNRKQSEQFTVKLSAENTQFTRFNHAKVRQTGWVVDGSIELTLSEDERSSSRQFPFTGNWEFDWEVANSVLQELREELPQLPVDPYLVLPTGTNTSREIHSGNLLTAEMLVPTLLELVTELDFAGLYAGGVVIKGYGDSNQQKHWFASNSFTLDYSLFTPEGQALKGIFAGSDWNNEAYTDQINDAKKQLKLLSRPAKELPRGQYKTYFEPAAVADLLAMLSWGGLSEADLQQGNSAFASLSRKEKHLSDKFSLKENFQRGLMPRFNEWGEVADPELGLIDKGVLVNTLINSRSAKEYKKNANGANGYESLRAPEIIPGSLDFTQILPSLNTGLYVSNLHYLNWSDRPTGRITGMTRYACFWVEDGEIVAPIENLRFDESLYRFWGENLVDLTDFQEFIPEVGTYERRHLGGSMVPGMLVEDFTYTL